MPAGVAVMRVGLGESRAPRKRCELPRAAAAREAGLADRADVAEQLIEEAAIATECRSFVADRIDRGDQLLAAVLDRDDVAGLIEAHVKNSLGEHPRISKCDGLR